MKNPYNKFNDFENWYKFQYSWLFQEKKTCGITKINTDVIIMSDK